jgi:hypothetical protein
LSIINCPTCGAKADSVVANCEYCGIEFARAQSLTPQEFVAAVGRSVLSYPSYEADEPIKAIPIPSDVPTLMAFFMFCHGNLSDNPIEFRNPDQSAWRAKARASFDMLRLASSENPKISMFLEEFKSTYSDAGIKEGSKAYNSELKKTGILVAVVWVIIGAVLLIVYYLNKN